MGPEILVYDVIATDISAGDLSHISALDFDAQLKRVAPGQTLTLRINSPGGSTAEASAIIAMLKRYKANGGRVIVRIDGYAVSAASWIAMMGDEIHIAEDAFVMIHEPSAAGERRAQEMRVAADVLEKLTASMAADYAARSGQTVERVKQMMADETWMNAQDAVRLGFADRVEQPMKMVALSAFKPFSYRNAPTDLVVPPLRVSAADIWAKWNRPYGTQRGRA
jgi:ATP-dependent protease ClpP protease subunit